MAANQFYSVGVGKGIAPLPPGKTDTATMERIRMIADGKIAIVADLARRRVEAMNIKDRSERRAVLKQIAAECKQYGMKAMADETMKLKKRQRKSWSEQ